MSGITPARVVHLYGAYPAVQTPHAPRRESQQQPGLLDETELVERSGRADLWVGGLFAFASNT